MDLSRLHWPRSPFADAPLARLLARVPPLRWLGLMLVGLHAALVIPGVGATGASLASSLMLLHFCLFLLWQPVVRRDAALSARVAGLLLGLAALLVFAPGVWISALWLALLTGLLGTMAASAASRAERVAYRLALLYSVAMLFAWVLPQAIRVPLPDALDLAVRAGLPGLPLAVLLLPARGRTHRVSGVDFVYGVFLVLLVLLIALAVLALMTVAQDGYAWALAQSLVGVAVLLLTASALWNPHPGFGGLGLLASRYMLSVGLPFERFASKLANLAERADDPDELVRSALENLCELDWIRGVRWHTASANGHLGEPTGAVGEFGFYGLDLRWHVAPPLTPALALHLRLVSQLTGFFYAAKTRERALRETAYQQAIAETGAQLTHDMKNLLQSMSVLLSAVDASPDNPRTIDDDGTRLAALLRRQLPPLSQRLTAMLTQLQNPACAPQPTVAAHAWWAALVARYADENVAFVGDGVDDSALPQAVFDSVADNLIANALRKRRSEAGLTIRVRFAAHPLTLEVCDDGAAVPGHVVSRLFANSVASGSGLGVGLFLAARQAARAGYTLSLLDNHAGNVRFGLQPAANACQT